MNGTHVQSPLILLGIGGAGAAAAAGIARAYGPGIRILVVDTDARSGAPDLPFVLLGGALLAGHGSGGRVPEARTAAKEDLPLLDEKLDGVRAAIVVTALGGGTGGGATVEILQHLRKNGIVTLLFATTPFAFEGEDHAKKAATVRSLLENDADASVFLPLDALVGGAGTDNMKDALQRGMDTLATGVTLLWRALEKPGYLRLDPERLRGLVTGAGPARFATATATGPDRAAAVVAALKASPLLAAPKGTPRTRAILLGLLAGDDLRLSEVGAVASGTTFNFGPDAELALGTVNDEATFSGRLTAVVLLFGEGRHNAAGVPESGSGVLVAGARRRNGAARPDGGLRFGPQGRGRFQNSEKSVWNGEDLDIPTYLRQRITLDR